MRKIGLALVLVLIVGGLWLYRSTAKAPPYSTDRKDKYGKLPDNPDPSGRESKVERGPNRIVPDLKQLQFPTSDLEMNSDSPHLNLVELRRRIRAGDVAGALSLSGTLEAQDTEALNSMFGDIPGSLSEEDRAKLLGKLVRLISQTPGDAALGFLYGAAREQRLLSFNDWTHAVVVLGIRRYENAVPYLESLALETDLTRVDANKSCMALAALLVMDSRNYVTRIAQLWGYGNDQTFWGNAYSMQAALTTRMELDFTPAIPFLQQRFKQTNDTWPSGRRILVELLESEAKKPGAVASRTWLICELRTTVMNEAQILEASELQYYKDVLARLEALKN